jgi:putative nucleotidyltransferase with HDIG domain
MLARQQAIEILAESAPEAPWTRHCYAVADAAQRIGSAVAPYRAVNMDFLWSAALLHDIGRRVTHDPVLHGVEGYKCLSALGHHEEAHICAAHILFGLRSDEAAQVGLPEDDFVPCTIEAQLVTLADFLMECDRPTTLERRFASLRRRNADAPFFLERLARAFAAAYTCMAQLEQETGKSIERLVAARDQSV